MILRSISHLISVLFVSLTALSSSPASAARTTFHYHYDPNGRLESVTDDSGSKAYFIYDERGNLIFEGSATLAVADRLEVDRSQQSEVAVEVRRGGSLVNAVEVSYRTVDGTARDGHAYRAVAGRLQWPAMDATTRTIRIPIIGGDPEQQFELRLFEPVRAGLVGVGAATIVVVANDTSEPLPEVVITGHAGTRLVDVVGCGGFSASGYFRCTKPGGWSGSIRPRREGWRFSPPERAYVDLRESKKGVRFAASAGDE